MSDFERPYDHHYPDEGGDDGLPFLKKIIPSLAGSGIIAIFAA